MLGFDFQVEYKPVAINVVADVMSRRDTEAALELVAISTLTFALFEDLRCQHREDLDVVKVKEEIVAGTHDAK